MRFLCSTIVLFSCAILANARLGDNEQQQLLQQQQQQQQQEQEQRRLQQNDNDNKKVRVNIGYLTTKAKDDLLNDSNMKVRFHIPRLKTVTVEMTQGQLNALEKSDAYASKYSYIEEDAPVELLVEVTPGNVAAVGGTSTSIPASNASSSCSDPNSLKVAIIDTGIHTLNPDIPCVGSGTPGNYTNCLGAMFVNSPYVGENWYVQQSFNGALPPDHGQHVFGIIGAQGGNDQIIRGILGANQGICFLIAKVFGGSGGTFDSNTYAGVDWAVSKGAKVINLSLSSGSGTLAQTAIQRARTAGAIIVASAGNAGTSAFTYPASFDGVLSVAAVDGSKVRASWSNYNNKVDFAAPGVSISSLLVTTNSGTKSGTSMASPHVAGVAAKLWSACPKCINTQIEFCMTNTTQNLGPVGYDVYYGFGFPQAAAAYTCLVSNVKCCV